MNTDRLASLAAAIVVGGGTLLAASGANAFQIAGNGWSLNGVFVNGLGMNGWSLNGAFNGATGSAVASQGFDFNDVSVQTVSWTWDCPLPLDRGKAVVCALGASAEKRR